MKKYPFLGVFTLLILGMLSNPSQAFPNLVGEKPINDPNYPGTIGLWVDLNIQTSAHLSFMVFWNFKVNNSVNLATLTIDLVEINIYNETPTTHILTGVGIGNGSPSSPIISNFVNHTVSGYALLSTDYVGSSVDACFVVSVNYSLNLQSGVNITHDGCINNGHLLTLSMPNTSASTKVTTLPIIPIFLSLIAITIFRKKRNIKQIFRS